jgi:hypothetical protein
MRFSTQKKTADKNFDLAIGLCPTRKRSSYFSLVVLCTNLHLVTSHDLGGFWKTKPSCFVFALFWLSVRSMFFA